MCVCIQYIPLLVNPNPKPSMINNKKCPKITVATPLDIKCSHTVDQCM